MKWFQLDFVSRVIGLAGKWANEQARMSRTQSSALSQHNQLNRALISLYLK